MKLETARKLMELSQEDGVIILIEDHPYVDSPVRSIYENDDGEIVYDSQVFSGRSLRGVYEYSVSVSRRVNWLEEVAV